MERFCVTIVFVFFFQDGGGDSSRVKSELALCPSVPLREPLQP